MWMCDLPDRYQSVDITISLGQSRRIMLSLPRNNRPVMQPKDQIKGSNGHSAHVTLASAKAVVIVMQTLDRSQLCLLTVADRLVRELYIVVVATHPKHVCHQLNITLACLCKVAVQ